MDLVDELLLCANLSLRYDLLPHMLEWWGETAENCIGTKNGATRGPHNGILLGTTWVSPRRFLDWVSFGDWDAPGCLPSWAKMFPWNVRNASTVVFLLRCR